MVLDATPLNVLGAMQSFLGMRSSHVGTGSPFGEDGVPSLFGSPRGIHPETNGIGTIQSNKTLRELVAKEPFLVRGR